MNMNMIRLQRFLRSRQLHTIISQETIKPSSPTPPHLKTHNLSVVDQLAPSVNVPFTFFYKNYNNVDINILKKSLSQSLTAYYPFAGRLISSSVPIIHCNDQGVEFLEASSDSRLNDIIFKKEVDEIIDQLVPNCALGNINNKPASLVEIQLNHFTCGGAALTISISHKLGDGFTNGELINHWAAVTRGRSPKNPTFFSSKSNNKVPELDFKGGNKVKYASRRFVFPNSKLKELKNKVNMSVNNPTRVETVSSLIFKCAVDAATTLSGSLQPSDMYHVVNMRKKIIQQNRPEIAVGNIVTVAIAKMSDYGEIKLHEVIAKLRKDITEIKEVGDVDELGNVILNKLSTFGDDQIRTYVFSSLCRFPFYEVDFGWGKPVQFMVKNGVLDGNIIHLMDTPSGDGIEAIVNLEEGEMAIFEKDKDIIAYTKDM